MNRYSSAFSLRRAAALLLSILLFLCQLPFAALASDAQSGLSFYLTWTEGDIAMQQMAGEVTVSGYEGSYWLYVPSGALQADAALHVQDLYGRYASFSIADGTPLSQLYYADAGTELGTSYLDVWAYDALGQASAQVRLYISTQTDTPATPAPAQVEVQLPVYYMDTDGNSLAQVTVTVRTGDNYVSAEDAYVPAGYTLVSSSPVYVSVDSYGSCNPSSVTFTYSAPAPTSTEVDFPVYYYDANGNFLNQESRRIATGTVDIWADDTKVPEGYTLSAANQNPVSVTVDAYGNCNPSSVTFYYDEPVPASTEVDFIVIYYDANGNFLNQESRRIATGTVDIWADDTKVPEGYTLSVASQNPVSVIVDEYGNCSPASVSFYYDEPVPASTEVDFIVIYYDANGSFLNQESRRIATGTVDIWADDTKVPEGYTLSASNQNPVSVTVDEYGNCSPVSVSFYYDEPVPTSTKVDFIVTYYDANGNYLNQESRRIATGTVDIWADDTKVPEGYTLNSASQNPVSVTVDEYGNCNPASVSFYYDEPVPASTEVDFAIIYYDNGGNFLNQETRRVATGTVDIWADDTKVPEGYTLSAASQNPVSVTVDEYGNCNPASVSFYYDEPVPASTEVDFIVTYYDANGNFLNQESRRIATGTVDIWADDTKVPEGYTLSASNQNPVSVTVDEYGNCNPASVSFYYDEPVPASTEVDFIVTYYDANGNYLNQESRRIATGTVDIWADDTKVPEGYTLNSASQNPVSVTVDEYGNCNPASVSFYYDEPVPASTEVDFTIIYYDNGGNFLNQETRRIATGTVDIWADDTKVPEGYTLSASNQNPVSVTVDENGNCAPSLVSFFYDKPEQQTVEVSLPVYYYDRNENLLYATTTLVRTGENTVAAAADLVDESYRLDSESPVRVVVDESGACSPEFVAFYFVSTAPTPTPAPVDVIVHYVDEDGLTIASDTSTRCVAGINPVRAAPIDLPSDYQLTDSDDVRYVFVDENGADLTEITFHYARVESTAAPTDQPTPDPKIALVSVSYRLDSESKAFFTDNPVSCYSDRENIVTVDMSKVPDGYTLIGSDTVQVTVDQNGIASPSAVEFIFSAELMTREVTIFYVNEAGEDIATPQTAVCYLGSNSIDRYTYAPLDLRAGYVPYGNDAETVTLSSDGILSPGYVQFIYAALPTQTPSPTPLPYLIYEMEGYCFPVGKEINLRSYPAIQDGNVLRTVSSNDLCEIEGYVVNAADETWYIVTFSGQTGYILADRVRVLSQDEVYSLFGYTPIPTATPVPDNTPIDRWGSVNDKSVRFRQSPGGKEITKAQKGVPIFVYDSVTVDGTQWYRANLDGTDGYMMAKFVDLLTKEESAAYQNSLASPMPVRTAEPTETPTVAPTEIPTATPTIVPTDTPVPVFTNTYALTTQKVDLRTGVSVNDITLATLPANTLLYLWGRTYVDGVAWDSADALAQNVSGFLPDSAVRYITIEEATPYLNAMQVQETATAQPTAQPEPFSGYAVTRGSNVMIRNGADDLSQIAQVLSEGEVVYVIGQEYISGYDYFWEVVRYGSIYGYVRSDQLRRMTTEEQEAYEASLRTPTPAPVPTVTAEPVTQSSTSSYGYVTTDNVRLRSGAGTNYNYIRMMSKYAFALVLGTEEVDGVTWYHISQSGTEGYVMGNYFKVLTLGELTEFLTSDEYRQSAANSGTESETTSVITPVEDFNSGVWKNPGTVQASYQPFTPIVTPTVNVEQIVTPTVAPTATPTPTVAPLSTTNFTEFTTAAPTTKSSGSGWLWIGLAAIAVLAGGGIYGYSIYRANQRRAAQRAAQRRHAQQQARAAQQNVYARPTQQYPQQNQAAQQPSVFTPPAPPQQTGASSYTSASQQSVNNPYQPQQSGTTQASSAGGTRHRRSDRHQS